MPTREPLGAEIDLSGTGLQPDARQVVVVPQSMPDAVPSRVPPQGVGQNFIPAPEQAQAPSTFAGPPVPEPTPEPRTEYNNLRMNNNVIRASSGAPEDRASAPSAVPIIARAHPDELAYGQRAAIEAMGREREALVREGDITHAANVQAADDAANAVTLQEARLREMRVREEARQAAVAAQMKRVEQVQKWGAIHNTFQTFFDGQRRLNAGILAAGLYRAQKPEQAMQTLQTAMAHEYEGQKQALAQAELDGRQAQNSLADYRQLFQDEKTADLAWEMEMNRLVAQKAKAAWLTAKTPAEKAGQEAIIARLDQKNAMILDSMGKDFTMSASQPLIARSTFDTNRGPLGPRGAGPTQTVGGNAPVVGPGGNATFPRLDSAREGLARAKGVFPTSPSGGKAAEYLSPTDAAKYAEQGNTVTSTQGRGSPSWFALQEILGKPGSKEKADHGDWHQTTYGGWAPKGQKAIAYNGLVRLVPEESFVDVSKAGENYLKRSSEQAAMAQSLAKVVEAQKKLGPTGALRADVVLDPTGLKKDVNDTINAYREANMAVYSLGADWWKKNVDEGVIRADEYKHLESLIPSLNSWKGMVGAYQAKDIQFIQGLMQRIQQDNARKMDAIVVGRGGTPADVVSVSNVRPETYRDGTKTGYWAYEPDFSGMGSHRIYMPGQWVGGPHVDTRAVKR